MSKRDKPICGITIFDEETGNPLATFYGTSYEEVCNLFEEWNRRQSMAAALDDAVNSPDKSASKMPHPE